MFGVGSIGRPGGRPHRVAGGPEARVQVKKLRVTSGTFIRTKQVFQVIDDYHINANSQRLLDGAWIGTSEFREVDNFIEDVDWNKKSIASADRDSESETHEPPHTPAATARLHHPSVRSVRMK